MDCVPQLWKREEGRTPAPTDYGSGDKLARGFEKRGDQSEGFRREFVDGYEGILDVLHLLPDIRDP
jgi:hypothetical protein